MTGAERLEVLCETLAKAGARAEMAGPVALRAGPLIDKFLTQMALRAPRHLSLAAALSDADRDELRAFYARFERAAIESVVMAALELELERERAGSGGIH